MAGTIVVDRIESDASYASTINVAGQITFSNTVNFGVFAGTAPVAGMYLPATNTLSFTTASTERMRINSSGNVGIGVTSIVSPLQIGTAAGSSPESLTGLTFRQGSGSPTAGYGYSVRWDNANNVASDVGHIAYGFGGSSTASAGFMRFSTADTERMRIDGNGNVGIGTTNPSRSKLVIGATTPQISFTDTDGTSNIIDITRIAGPGLTFSSNGTEVGRFDSAGLFKFNSGYGSAATAYGCRAWVNFNGTGTVAIRASGNVTSITDNGVGDYTVNFTTAMPDVNYAASGFSGTNRLVAWNQTSLNYATTGLRIAHTTAGSAETDDRAERISVSIFR